MKKSELIELLRAAWSQMKMVGDELNWSEPIDEGYVHTHDEMRDALRKIRRAENRKRAKLENGSGETSI